MRIYIDVLRITADLFAMTYGYFCPTEHEHACHVSQLTRSTTGEKNTGKSAFKLSEDVERKLPVTDGQQNVRKNRLGFSFLFPFWGHKCFG